MSSLAERLKERKRVQWAIAYAGAALCLLEVLGIVARNFGWSALITRSAIVLGGIGFFITFSRVGPGVEEQATVAPSPSTGKPSVAVLPFDNRSQRPDYANLMDGIPDQILKQLSKLASLRMISRTSVMEYTGELACDRAGAWSSIPVGRRLSAPRRTSAGDGSADRRRNRHASVERGLRASVQRCRTLRHPAVSDR
ncbi:MAG: hypothetical protein O6853_01140 [Actinobacteria bacterium]|nr:hypothetical protein [Actinomycetota bacterium]